MSINAQFDGNVTSSPSRSFWHKKLFLPGSDTLRWVPIFSNCPGARNNSTLCVATLDLSLLAYVGAPNKG
eukprot:6010586-Lingulodinium_polyedra.AAC.1